MKDFTHSFITNSSMIPPYHEYPSPPNRDPITTIVHLKSIQKIYAPSTNSLLNNIATTPAGQAFRTFLQAVKEEEGYKSILWGPDLDKDNDIVLFIAWKKHPTAPFTSSVNFRDIPPTSPLAALRQYLSSPARVTNVVLHPWTFNQPTLDCESFELIIWRIPPSLDPTYHLEHAQRFNQLSDWFLWVQGDDRNWSLLLGDLRQVYRGWARSGGGNMTIADTDVANPLEDGFPDGHDDSSEIAREPPSSDAAPNSLSPPGITSNRPMESTHVFIFWWKDMEAEARFKDPSMKGLAGGLRELTYLEWQTGFEDMQEKWKHEGMRVDRHPLTLRYWRDSKPMPWESPAVDGLSGS